MVPKTLQILGKIPTYNLAWPPRPSPEPPRRFFLSKNYVWHISGSEILHFFNLGSFTQGELKGTNWMGQTEPNSQFFRRFSLIFADFRFSWELQHFRGADFRRKPHETADFRRKAQETADFRRNPFVPFGLSLLSEHVFVTVIVIRGVFAFLNFSLLIWW